MSLTPSEMIPLGTPAPGFELPECEGGVCTLADLSKEARATVVMFICNHCPFVQHIELGIKQLADDFIGQGVAFVGICSNDTTAYPEDAPEKMREKKQDVGYAFPYCSDASQTVAMAYHAACTPDFYVFDASLACVYRGRLDDARPGNAIPVTGADLRAALRAVLDGVPVPKAQHPSLGCNIKWRET